MSKVFISYSSKDRDRVRQIKGALEGLGKYQLWFDQDAILPGGYYAKDIAIAIREVELFLLIVSQYSVGDKTKNIYGSDEVSNELALAKACGALIIPIKLDDSWIETTTHADFEYLMARSQWLDAAHCHTESDFFDLAKRIEQAFEQGGFQFDYQKTLDEIDSLLKQGEFLKAQTRINNNSFPQVATERLLLMNTIITLSSQPVRNFSQQLIDNLAVQLSQVNDKELKPFSLYLLGVLSRFFYQKNAIVDLTGGISVLKQQAAGANRLKAKYTLMTEHILPANNGFALMWMRHSL